ncbi:MAG: GntR family transcriptional regulator, partial [Beijerinckiaceae bacterium]|nr:GntR family transcriptional regulator [Beijerinckiaceae bacterium]
KLKALILDNEIPAGSQMLELEAAARLGMSRTPVREAMVRLEQEGMVELRSRHGMRVLPISADALAEIYEILTALEGMAAESAARKGATGAQLAELQQAVDDMEAALEADDLDRWSRADATFHGRLVALAGNRRLAALVDQVADQAHRARATTLRLRPKPVGSNRDHAALVQAISERDPARARQIHEHHRRQAAEMLVNLVRDLGLKQL